MTQQLYFHQVFSMTITVKLPNNTKVTVNGKEGEPAVVVVPDFGIDILGREEGKNGYICEDSAPSDAMEAEVGKSKVFVHQQTKEKFVIVGGD